MEQLNFPQSFFEDEVRDGFFVPGMMKRYWAEELEVLHTFADICERHNIPWCAGEGTLIGAVRHHGFIPWDDDIDVYIMRDDAQRFLDAARQELPKAYTVMTTADDAIILNSLIRLANGIYLHASLEDLEQHHGCPYPAGIDIFLLDGIFPDETKEQERMARVTELRKAVEKAWDKPNFKDLRMQKEKAYAACPVRDAEEIILFWEPGNRTARFRKEWFASYRDVPFETTTIRIPVGYDQVLRTIYGDYHTPYRAGGGHGYPCYRNQQEIYEKSAGHRPLAYTFSEEDATRERPVTKRGQIERTLQTVAALREKVQLLQSSGNAALADQLRAGLTQAETALQEQSGGRDWNSKKKEILFLPVRAAWWPAMENAYREAMADENTDVFVMPLPWYEKNLDGTTGAEHDERELFPDEIETVSLEEYHVAARCPDVIVTQYPFDGFSLYMTVPPFFFAENLPAYTEKLVYVPCFLPDTPAENEAKARITLQFLIEQPAVMFADEVFVPTEGMRAVYIDWLCRLGGESLRDIWERKIQSGSVVCH